MSHIAAPRHQPLNLLAETPLQPVPYPIVSLALVPNPAILTQLCLHQTVRGLVRYTTQRLADSVRGLSSVAGRNQRQRKMPSMRSADPGAHFPAGHVRGHAERGEGARTCRVFSLPFRCLHRESCRIGLRAATGRSGLGVSVRTQAKNTTGTRGGFTEHTLAETPLQSGVPGSLAAGESSPQSSQSPSSSSPSCSHSSYAATIDACANAHCVARTCSCALASSSSRVLCSASSLSCGALPATLATAVSIPAAGRRAIFAEASYFPSRKWQV